jgi:catalase
MNGVEKHIQLRHIVHCYKADPAYGQGVADALVVTWHEVEEAVGSED